jgi:hypothetical protein
MGSDHTAWSQALPNFQHKLSTKPLICGRHFHHGSVVAVRAGSHINFALLAKALPSESIVTEEVCMFLEFLTLFMIITSPSALELRCLENRTDTTKNVLL